MSAPPNAAEVCTTFAASSWSRPLTTVAAARPRAHTSHLRRREAVAVHDDPAPADTTPTHQYASPNHDPGPGALSGARGTVRAMNAEQPRVSAPAEGLERHPSLDDRFDPSVRIADYDPAWPTLAEAEVGRLKEALGEVAVRLEHVGSTAVPGLAAKPILDLQLSVDAIEPRERYVEPLGRLGYLFVPAPEAPDYHFFAKPAERPRTHHLHVCEVGTEHEFRHVAVRDFLRTHVDEAARYAALKRKVVARDPHDRLAYIEGKYGYVSSLEERAVAWARSRG
jgi:GrpB-like predicted nucleotidyltransferase (UPF0157 family)